MTEIVQAQTFHRFMTAGRTSPAVFGCSNNAGEELDYVVKIRGGCDFGTSQLVREIAAAKLADHLHIPHPHYAFVDLSDDLAELVAQQESDKAAIIRNSVGMNFGTVMLTNLITWPVDRQLSASQQSDASAIFAFDVLIQNPDRQFNRPNLGSVGDQLFVFDHELAFSSQYALFPKDKPWLVADDGTWTNHVFYNQLKRQPVALTDFFDRLGALPDDFFSDLAAELPEAWDAQALTFISDYVRTMSHHSLEFADELTRRLA